MGFNQVILFIIRVIYMNNTNDKMRQCVFVNAFEILIKNIIIPYFITQPNTRMIQLNYVI